KISILEYIFATFFVLLSLATMVFGPGVANYVIFMWISAVSSVGEFVFGLFSSLPSFALRA
ncbi:MAG: hypothetical protein AAGD12_12670, partial [Pseudomonadota bacterium]